MAGIRINQERVGGSSELCDLCPFGAIEMLDGRLIINSACKMCRLCIKKAPEIFEFVETTSGGVDKSQWQGIAVYADHHNGRIQHVTFELIGKALELAGKSGQEVLCLLAGYNVSVMAEELLAYGVDAVAVYDDEALNHFRIEPYTAVFEDFINHFMPSTILVGGTVLGRSLAPRVAARFRTGLTADCTVLDMRQGCNLDQIRPAFGGNIMAHIQTPEHRPQFATVRPKIFDAPERSSTKTGDIFTRSVDAGMLVSGIRVKEIKPRKLKKGIEDAHKLIVAGRGIKKETDMEMIHNLAEIIGAEVAGTRTLIETGWLDAKRQIGLSGRTVKPKLLLTVGVSGAVQFVAGMQGAEHVVAINTDPNAPIFKSAHVGIVGDLYEIIPELTGKLARQEEVCA